MSAKDNPTDTQVYATVGDVGKKIDHELRAEDFEEVEDIIASEENYVDRSCNHAWRERERTESKEKIMPREGYEGVAIFLDRESVREVKSLEISYGRNQVDYVSERTKGRNSGNWWVDENEGIIYIRDVTYNRTEYANVTYTYGDERVPRDIKRAVVLLSAAELLRGEGDTIVVPEGGERVSIGAEADSYEEKAERKLKNHKRFTPAHI